MTITKVAANLTQDNGNEIKAS